MAAASALLELVGVTKDYVAGPGAPPVRVLHGVSLRLDAGETLAIVGPSGCGKSTLLNLAGALDLPTEGEVSLSGRVLNGMGDEELARLRNQELGFVFQSHHLLPQCSVLENVLVPTLAFPSGQDAKANHERARGLLDRVGLGHRLEHRPAQLSGGERQRTAVVRALINRPKLLLADEPTGALDGASAAALADLLVELNREEKVGLILVTHAPDLAARMSRIGELKAGRLSIRTA